MPRGALVAALCGAGGDSGALRRRGRLAQRQLQPRAGCRGRRVRARAAAAHQRAHRAGGFARGCAGVRAGAGRGQDRPPRRGQHAVLQLLVPRVLGRRGDGEGVLGADPRGGRKRRPYLCRGRLCAVSAGRDAVGLRLGAAHGPCGGAVRRDPSAGCVRAVLSGGGVDARRGKDGFGRLRRDRGDHAPGLPGGRLPRRLHRERRDGDDGLLRALGSVDRARKRRFPAHAGRRWRLHGVPRAGRRDGAGARHDLFRIRRLPQLLHAHEPLAVRPGHAPAAGKRTAST